MQIQIFGVWLGKIEVYDSKHDKLQFLNNRMMNARTFYLLTKNKSFHMVIRMPSLFYQARDHNNFLVDKPTRYNKFWMKVRKIRYNVKQALCKILHT